jgi:hypothetical protein
VASELGLGVTPRIRACLSGASGARELPACGPGGARRKGGVSLLQALVGNKRSCRLGTVGQSKWAMLGPLVARGRAPSGRNREGQSTARHSGGPARSSDEGPVTEPERRGWAGQGSRRSTRKGRNR